jgi:hypothetical protein
MPKGGLRRDGHHCPQRYLGRCRWVNKPVRHCATHSNKCSIHDMPHQTYQRDRMCEGEQDAAERAFRKQQVSVTPPENCQPKKGGPGKKFQGRKKRQIDHHCFGTTVLIWLVKFTSYRMRLLKHIIQEIEQNRLQVISIHLTTIFVLAIMFRHSKMPCSLLPQSFLYSHGLSILQVFEGLLFFML